MSDSKTHDDGRLSDLAVLEANEYKQRRRLERILDALDGVQDTADEAWGNYVQGEISREARNITIQRAVKNAIRECYKLLLDHSRSVEGRDDYWAGDAAKPLGSVSLMGDAITHIDGLRDFLDAPTFFESEVTETVSERNMAPRTVTRTVETTMPEKVSYRAYLRLKEFLDDVHDMEIAFEQMDDQLPNWGFEAVDDDELPEDVEVI